MATEPGQVVYFPTGTLPWRVLEVKQLRDGRVLAYVGLETRRRATGTLQHQQGDFARWVDAERLRSQRG